MLSLQPLANKIRRNILEKIDYNFISLLQIFKKKQQIGRYNINIPRIALITVNYNTLKYLKLMLASLYRCELNKSIGRYIIIDNNSKDGSREFLNQITEVENYHVFINKVTSDHGSSLRFGIKKLNTIEKKLAPEERSNLLLIVDTDIIFFKKELLNDALNFFRKKDVALLGQIQNDTIIPYIHPSCMLLNKYIYNHPNIWPFLNSGAPALKMQSLFKP